jgi:hypothetical protein
MVRMYYRSVTETVTSLSVARGSHMLFQAMPEHASIGIGSTSVNSAGGITVECCKPMILATSGSASTAAR